MGPEVEHACYESIRFSVVTPSGNHGKIPITETPFHSVSYVLST